MGKDTFIFEDPQLDHLNDLQNILRIAILNQKVFMTVAGDCMEGAGIEEGGRVAVDFTHYPRPERRENGIYVSGDPCVCWGRFPGMPNPELLCKQYVGVLMGHQVRSHHRQESGKPNITDYAFRADIILGVVYESYGRDGRLIWKRDPAEYPEKLPDRITVTHGNVVAESCVVLRKD